MPHVARDTITAVIADMPHKTKDLEMQIFAVFIISKVFDETVLQWRPLCSPGYKEALTYYIHPNASRFSD